MESILKKNEGYIDRVAMLAMEKLFIAKSPKNAEDSRAISRIAYQQALAMLEVKLSLESLARTRGFLKNVNKEIKIKSNDRPKINSRNGGLGDNGEQQ